VIRHGIPDTEMPGTSLDDTEIRQLAAHVRALGRVPAARLAGDPERGKQIFDRHGCWKCHTIQARGGAFGPDLTGIGERRSAAYLRESLIDPGARVPRGFLQVRLVTRAGEAITGARINEDTFSIQIRDLDGAVHSFWKSDLRELHKDLGRSPMPSYRTGLSPEELDQLVAYLAGLQEKP
jgi:putative heme-binding domain-containing protein